MAVTMAQLCLYFLLCFALSDAWMPHHRDLGSRRQVGTHHPVLLQFTSARTPLRQLSAINGGSNDNDREDPRHALKDDPSCSLNQFSRRRWITSSLAAMASSAVVTAHHMRHPSAVDVAHAAATSSAVVPITTTTAVCDSTVSVWKEPNRNRLVYILGTAHISQLSADLAGQLVRDVHPDAVFVELDLKRVGGLPRGVAARRALPQSGSEEEQTSITFQTGDIGEEGASSTTIPTPQTNVVVPLVSSTTTTSAATTLSPTDMALPVETESAPPAGRASGIVAQFQQRALGFGAAALGNAVRAMYKNLGKAGFQPGEEFAAAIKEAQAANIPVVLGDQDVEYTLRRLTQALAVTDLDRLLNDKELEEKMQSILPGGPPPAAPIQSNIEKDPEAYKAELSAYIERLKSRDSVRQIMAELGQVAPALVQVMLTERDAYMAAGIDTLNQFECIVAVMGLAHMDGVERNLKQRGWRPVALRCP